MNISPLILDCCDRLVWSILSYSLRTINKPPFVMGCNRTIPLAISATSGDGTNYRRKRLYIITAGGNKDVTLTQKVSLALLSSLADAICGK